MLYLAGVFVGIWGGVAIGLVTPVIALCRGILPSPWGPMDPVIALGNAVWVINYGLLEKCNNHIDVVLSSVIKYLVLVTAVRLIACVPP